MMYPNENLNLQERENLTEMQNIAEQAHRNFVNAMWQRFMLNTHPEYCLIEIVPMLSLGGFSYGPPDIISLNDLLTTAAKFEYESWHESSHFLDPFCRELHNKGEMPIPEDRLLHEIVSILAIMVYVDSNKEAEKVYEFVHNNSPLTYSAKLALDIFDGNKDILPELVHADMRTARPKIMPYIKRELDISKDPYDES